MILQEFLTDALTQPCAHTSYYVSRRLAEIYPARHIVEGVHYEFEIERYAANGNCAFVREVDLHSQMATEFTSSSKSLTHEVVNGWLNVLWRGAMLDVLLLTLGDNRLHWIIADERKIAEEFFREVCLWASEVRGEVLVFERGYWQKDRELFRAVKGANFDDLILPHKLKGELRTDLAEFFASRETYERYSIPWKRGVLLIGPPGNGKTGAIKALINSLNVPCLYVKSLISHHDTDHAGVRAVFERARSAAPCLLVLEDLDSLVTDANRSYFLNELDGFAANTGVAVLASTNHPERLDSSILDRPSRFDRKFYFDLPAKAERLAYLAKWNAGLEAEMRLTDEGMTRAADATGEFSFAYLKEAALSAMMWWMRERRAGTMDAGLLERIAVLRAQMSEAAKKAPSDVPAPSASTDEDDEWCLNEDDE